MSRMIRHSLRAFTVTALLLVPLATLHAESILPGGWDPALAGDIVMQRLMNTSAPRVKGAHDAEFACVGDCAYVVAEVNALRAGESAAWPFIYVTMSIVNLNTLDVNRVIDFARGEQRFENETLPAGACFVPRILQKDAHTLRCFFTSEAPGKRQSQMWYRDFDMKAGEFAPTIHKVKLQTAAGTFDFQPQYFHADAMTQGFTKPMTDSSFFIFDSFKKFEGQTYVTLNNFSGKQNALALVHDDLVTFEVLGHYNEPQTEQLSESAVNRLPDGTWMAICRNDNGGNYYFTRSVDGKTWTPGKTRPHVPNGTNSKPTFDKFGGVYYLGWQEATRIQGVARSVFNVDISRDGQAWERKYRFETPKSFQYPTFHEHQGTIWLVVTQGDHDASRKERIMFGKLESVGNIERQVSQRRIIRPAPTEESAVMKRGVKLFTDRDYVIDELPKSIRGLAFLRTSIEQMEVVVAKAGTLFALTPTERPKASSQHDALVKSGFTKIETPEVQLFPGEINRVSLYRKEVTAGERLRFKKLVLLIPDSGAELTLLTALNTAQAISGVEQAHAELWNKFVDRYGIIHDYVGELPTPEDCLLGKPNAIGWWSPIEDGPMFTGLYLPAVCERARRSDDPADKAQARILARGLMKCASVSEVPGMIVRGVGTDGTCHYPLGSDDQTHPWFYGLHTYVMSDLPTADERREIVAKMKVVADALESTGWQCLCDGAFKGQFRGGYRGHLFRDAARYLYMLRAMHEVTGDRVWLDRYLKAQAEHPAHSDKSRAEICAQGYAFDREAIQHIDEFQLWIYVGSQASLAKLVAMETNESLRSHYRTGLAINAKNALAVIHVHETFDNNDTKIFGNASWRAVFTTWFPQATQADAERLSKTGDNAKRGERKYYEQRLMQNPLAAGAIVALAGDGTGRAAIEHAINHYDYSKLHMATFFFAECAAYALPVTKSANATD